MLSVSAISKSYVGVRALREVSMEVRPREVVGLIGENGAGKSTLMRVLAGSVRPDSGEMRVDGTRVSFRNPREANAHGIGMVFQEQSLLLNMTVAENIFLGQEGGFTRAGVIDGRRLNAAARAQLAKVGMDIDPATRTEELSFAARQMVELAKALALEDRTDRRLIILLDEPTSVLEARDIAILFDRVRALKARASFVFVSHRLDEVLDISDRVYVMRDGQVVAERAADAVTVPELHRMMVGRGLHSEYYREARQAPPRPEVALETRGLGVRGAYRDVDLVLREGEVLGIAGVIGSGREELTRTLFGFLPPTSGTIHVRGREVALRAPSQAVRLGIGYIPRERRVEGLVMFLSVATNITLANLGAVMWRGLIDHGRERRLARDWVGRLRIRTPGVATACRNLSGGNQQKVVLARWMTANARILILDHPTRGLDVGAKEEVYDLVRTLSDEGVAIILASDTLEETIGLCHRIMVMRDGAVTGRFDAPAGGKPDQVGLLAYMV
jgi:ribose transport system ATP-binding protein